MNKARKSLLFFLSSASMLSMGCVGQKNNKADITKKNRADFAYNYVDDGGTTGAISIDTKEAYQLANSNSYTLITSVKKNAYLYEIYESSSIKYTNDDKYMGLKVTQNNNIDINFVFSNTTIYGEEVTISGGAEISIEAGFKLFDIGASVGFSETIEFSKSYEDEVSKCQYYNLCLDKNDNPTDYYLYARGYKTDYLIVEYRYGQATKAAKVLNQDGITYKYALLQKKPVFLTPLASKC